MIHATQPPPYNVRLEKKKQKRLSHWQLHGHGSTFTKPVTSVAIVNTNQIQHAAAATQQ